MRQAVWCASVLALFISGAALAENEAPKEKKDAKAALYAKIAEGPAGVCKAEIDKNSKGRISSVLVVGKSRISTVLGKAEGIELAQQRAVNNAKIKFLQWLKEEATVRQGQDDETVILTDGAEEEGKEDAKKDTGRRIDKNTTKFETASKGLVRGLQIVYYEQDGKGKTYTIIMKWSARVNDAAEKTEKDLNKPALKEGEKKRGDKDEADPGDKTATPAKKPGDKKIPSKKGVVDE